MMAGKLQVAGGKFTVNLAATCHLQPATPIAEAE